jgi:hypothetical protein
MNCFTPDADILGAAYIARTSETPVSDLPRLVRVFFSEVDLGQHPTAYWLSGIGYPVYCLYKQNSKIPSTKTRTFCLGKKLSLQRNNRPLRYVSRFQRWKVEYPKLPVCKSKLEMILKQMIDLRH